jgi:hypothetical protein
MTSRTIGATIVVTTLVTTCAAVPLRAQARADSMGGAVGQWWSMLQRQFVTLAEAMPEEKYSFKPTGGAFDNVRTFAEQVKHVACANVAFFNEIEHKTPPEHCETGGPSPAKTKAELVAYLRESFAYGDKTIREMTPANAMDPVDGPYGGPTTRLGITTLAVWHGADHYGQVVVYLRMNGIVPPASAGTK